jgi:hypothetical protein
MDVLWPKFNHLWTISIIVSSSHIIYHSYKLNNFSNYIDDLNVIYRFEHEVHLIFQIKISSYLLFLDIYIFLVYFKFLVLQVHSKYEIFFLTTQKLLCQCNKFSTLSGTEMFCSHRLTDKDSQ